MTLPLNITTVQTFLYWEDRNKNLVHFDEKINAITHSTDIIVLPEMFTTGFTMNPEVFAEKHHDEGLQWMLNKAKTKACVIIGSIAVKEDGNYYNRLYWVNPDGSFQFYNKRHLFSMGKEHEHYTAGNKKLIIEYKGWKICPLICYDLRFPVWSRNTKKELYDILLYIANWPEIRSYPWKQLLIARAIENQCYVVGVNRIGLDANKIAHAGDSVILNPRGEKISKTKDHEDISETTLVSYDYLLDFRKSFPVISDGDEFSII